MRDRILIMALTQILILTLLLATDVAADSCSCSMGSGASLNFLGDSSININMDSYEEFTRSSLEASSVSVQNLPGGSQSRMSLNLNDGRSIYLIITKKQADLSGEGSMNGFNGTETLAATGIQDGSTLSMDVTASSGSIFKFNLTAEGSLVRGSFDEAHPGGEIKAGEAEGSWRKE